MSPTQLAEATRFAGSQSEYLEWATSIKQEEGIAMYFQNMAGEDFWLTKTGRVVDQYKEYGEWLETRNVTGQLITKAEPVAGSQAVEVYTGDVIDTATGQVISRGATATSVTLGTVASAGCAVLGGVVTGVNMYQSNPDFWTALSQTLLPYCYDNPTEGGWDNVWDALFPVAVDSNGTTMIPQEAMQSLYDFFVSTGALDPSGAINIDDVDKSVLYFPNYNYRLYPLPVPVTIVFPYGGTNYLCRLAPSTPNVFAFYTGSTSFGFVSTEPFTVQRTNSQGGSYLFTSEPKTKNGITYYVCSPASDYIVTAGQFPQSLVNGGDPNASWDVAYLAYHGTIETAIEGLSPEAGATTPKQNEDIATTYPNWQPTIYKNITEDSEGNQTISDISLLPITFPDFAISANDFKTDKSQADSFTGSTTSPGIVENLLFPPTTPTTPTDSGNTGTPTPPIIPPLNGAMAGIFHVYNPSLVELESLNSYMWTENIAKLIAEIFNNNPVDAVIGLQALYATPHLGGRDTIKLGYLDSGIYSDYVDEQFITINCGDKVVPEYFQAAYDYEPYTKVYAFLPFIGIRQLSPYDIIGGKVNITYTIDVLTGICCAKITVDKGENSALLYTFDGSCACELPVTAGSRASQIKNVVGGVIGGATSGAMIGGVAGAIAGGVVGGIGGAARGAEISMSGNVTGVAGACAPRKPFIIIKRTRPYNAANYNTFYGKPANATVRLGNLSGFTRVKKVHVEGLNKATNEEKIMIRDMLMQGVII